MQIGDTLPHFNLLGTDNEMHSTNDLNTNTAAIVIIFTCNHCPYARAYINRINSMVNHYEAKNVTFFAISANDVENYPSDSFENMIPMGKSLNLHGKYLYDETQEIALTFQAQRTPEVFVFDKSKDLAYHGALDDNHESEEEVKHHYLTDAIDALLANQKIVEKETDAIGCSIKWK